MSKQTLILTIELPPSINAIYRKNQWGSIYLTREGKKYKERMIEYIKTEVGKQGWIKTSSDVFVFMDEVVFMNKKGRDADNLKKLTQDVLTESECVWFDDTQCLPRTNRILIDSNNPRIEIVLTEADFIGIFDDKIDLESFIEDNCSLCKRGKNLGEKGSCSIYKEALDNRIQEAIVDGVCQKKK